MEEAIKAIGHNIKMLRKEKNMTQEELAKRLGKTKRTVQNYEAGITDIPQTTMALIANALQVSVIDFYTIRNAIEKLEREKPEVFKTSEERVLAALRVLNNEGQHKVASYAEDLTKIPDYLKKEGE